MRRKRIVWPQKANTRRNYYNTRLGHEERSSGCKEEDGETEAEGRARILSIDILVLEKL